MGESYQLSVIPGICVNLWLERGIQNSGVRIQNDNSIIQN